MSNQSHSPRLLTPNKYSLPTLQRNIQSLIKTCCQQSNPTLVTSIDKLFEPYMSSRRQTQNDSIAIVSNIALYVTEKIACLSLKLIDFKSELNTRSTAISPLRKPSNLKILKKFGDIEAITNDIAKQNTALRKEIELLSYSKLITCDEAKNQRNYINNTNHSTGEEGKYNTCSVTSNYSLYEKKCTKRSHTPFKPKEIIPVLFAKKNSIGATSQSKSQPAKSKKSCIVIESEYNKAKKVLSEKKLENEKLKLQISSFLLTMKKLQVALTQSNSHNIDQLKIHFEEEIQGLVASSKCQFTVSPSKIEQSIQEEDDTSYKQMYEECKEQSELESKAFAHKIEEMYKQLALYEREASIYKTEVESLQNRMEGYKKPMTLKKQASPSRHLYNSSVIYIPILRSIQRKLMFKHCFMKDTMLPTYIPFANKTIQNYSLSIKCSNTINKPLMKIKTVTNNKARNLILVVLQAVSIRNSHNRNYEIKSKYKCNNANKRASKTQAMQVAKQKYSITLIAQLYNYKPNQYINRPSSSLSIIKQRISKLDISDYPEEVIYNLKIIESTADVWIQYISQLIAVFVDQNKRMEDIIVKQSSYIQMHKSSICSAYSSNANNPQKRSDSLKTTNLHLSGQQFEAIQGLYVDNTIILGNKVREIFRSYKDAYNSNQQDIMSAVKDYKSDLSQLSSYLISKAAKYAENEPNDKSMRKLSKDLFNEEYDLSTLTEKIKNTFSTPDKNSSFRISMSERKRDDYEEVLTSKVHYYTDGADC